MNIFETFENGFHTRFRSDWRKAFIASCLGRLTDHERLVDFMFRYATFNSIFAGGIASLAGKIHVSQHVFRDRDDTEFQLADRSAEIASRIFFAAEDEYDVCHLGKRVTHRALAQLFLRELLRVCQGGDMITLNERRLDETHSNLMSEVLEAYQATHGNEDEALFYAMGFHLASEQFADQEFNTIDEFLKRHVPTVVQSLQGMTGPAGFDAYYWITTHCIVETEHAEFAADGIRLAFDYYVGDQQRNAILNAALKGVADFARIQESLFRNASGATQLQSECLALTA
ncbi:MAG: hypothetical protein QOF24_2560 [Verrucomicrobiota bacterium]|jgi:hypothetical protein